MSGTDEDGLVVFETTDGDRSRVTLDVMSNYPVDKHCKKAKTPTKERELIIGEKEKIQSTIRDYVLPCQKRLVAALQRHNSKTGHILIATTPFSITSTANGSFQIGHTDSQRDPKFRKSYSVIYGIGQQFHLVVWPGSHKFSVHAGDPGFQRFPIEPILVHIPKTGFIIFDQELHHAGGGYLVDNTRLHFYIDLTCASTQAFGRIPVEIYPPEVEDQAYFLPFVPPATSGM
jgi:hypothetical protein